MQVEPKLDFGDVAGLTLPSLLMRYVHRGKTASTSASADPAAAARVPAAVSGQLCSSGSMDGGMTVTFTILLGIRPRGTESLLKGCSLPPWGGQGVCWPAGAAGTPVTGLQ